MCVFLKEGEGREGGGREGKEWRVASIELVNAIFITVHHPDWPTC